MSKRTKKIIDAKCEECGQVFETNTSMAMHKAWHKRWPRMKKEGTLPPQSKYFETQPNGRHAVNGHAPTKEQPVVVAPPAPRPTGGSFLKTAIAQRVYEQAKAAPDFAAFESSVFSAFEALKFLTKQ